MALSGSKTGFSFMLLFIFVWSALGNSGICSNDTFPCNNTVEYSTPVTTQDHVTAMTTDSSMVNKSSSITNTDVAMETTDLALTTDGDVAMGTTTMETALTLVNATDAGDDSTAAQDDAYTDSDDVNIRVIDINAESKNVNAKSNDVKARYDNVSVPLTSSYPAFTSEKYDSTTLDMTLSPSGFVEQRSGADLDLIQTFRMYQMKATLALDIVGIALNALSLTVLYQMRGSVSNTYLMILTVCDMIFVVVNVPYNAMQLALITKPSMPWVYAYYSLYFETPVHVASRNTAAVVCAFMASDRFQKIAFPLKNLHRSCLHKPVPLAVVTGVLIYAYVVFDLAIRLKVGEMYSPVTNATIVGHIPNMLYIDNFDLFSTLFLIWNCFIRYLPAFVLIVANICLLVSLRLHVRGTHSISNTTNIIRTNSSIRSAKLVLIFSFVFFFLSLPFVVFTMLMMMYQDTGVLIDPMVWEIWATCLPSFDALNSSVNFFVLSVANPVFRQGVKVLILERGDRDRRGQGSSNM